MTRYRITQQRGACFLWLNEDIPLGMVTSVERAFYVIEVKEKVLAHGTAQIRATPDKMG